MAPTPVSCRLVDGGHCGQTSHMPELCGAVASGQFRGDSAVGFSERMLGVYSVGLVKVLDCLMVQAQLDVGHQAG